MKDKPLSSKALKIVNMKDEDIYKHRFFCRFEDVKEAVERFKVFLDKLDRYDRNKIKREMDDNIFGRFE